MDARIHARVHEKASGVEMIETGQYAVYGLISPRAGWLFYVGVTANLSRRLSQHRSTHNKCSSRIVVEELEEFGETFEHCVFGVFDDKDEALKLESKLIYGIPDVVNFRSSRAHCGGDHPAFDCKKSTAAGTQALPVDANSCRDSVRLYPQLSDPTTSAGTVGNEDRQPIPKRARGRPRTITDMRSYKAAKQREYRERKKGERQ